MYRRFGFFGGDLRPDPPKSEGILKTPRALRGARGVFKIPEGLRGSVAKIPDKKPESYAYFFIQLLLQTNTAQHQTTSTEHLR